jgi:sugar-specific transcriptional regulator TrmB
MDMEYKEDAIDKVLTDLGLTKYEAMVYRSLIKLGEAKAIEIAQTSGVPREKTYQVLRELEDKGIVKRIEGKPRRWVALPPKSIFEDIIVEKKKEVNKMEEIIKEMQSLYEAGFKKIERKDLNVWEIGESGFEESFLSSISYANINIYALLTPITVDKLSYDGMEAIKKLYRKDVDVKIMTWIYEDNLHDLARLSQYTDVYILDGDPTDISFYVIDGKTGFIIRDGKEYIIQYTDSRIAHSIIQVFKKLLRHAVKIEDYLQYWEAIETLERSDILYPRNTLMFTNEIISNIMRNKLFEEGFDGEIYKSIKEVYRKYFPEYDNLHILNKVQIVNLLLKRDPLFRNTTVSLDIPTETLVIDIVYEDNLEWIREMRNYRKIIPPSLHLLFLEEELKELGWREEQTILIEDKASTRPFEPRKIRIIKKFKKPL